jgi:hypothetical protein
MAMKNYKVVQEDGSETFYQFDDSTDEGKAGLAALRAAAKNSDSPVQEVTPGEPEPINASGSAKAK